MQIRSIVGSDGTDPALAGRTTGGAGDPLLPVS